MSVERRLRCWPSVRQADGEESGLRLGLVLVVRSPRNISCGRGGPRGTRGDTHGTASLRTRVIHVHINVVLAIVELDIRSGAAKSRVCHLDYGPGLQGCDCDCDCLRCSSSGRSCEARMGIWSNIGRWRKYDRKMRDRSEIKELMRGR